MRSIQPPVAEEPEGSAEPPQRFGIGPVSVLILSSGLAAVIGVLTDWQTAANVFVAFLALFSGARRS